MKKIVVGVVMVAALTAFAQEVAEPVLTAGDLPLPESWKTNALIVLTVNFVLGLIAVGVRKIPGKVGEIIQKLIDLVSANVEHKKK